MSHIERVEVHEFAFELPDLGWDRSGFNIVCQPKNKLKLPYAVVIEADDGWSQFAHRKLRQFIKTPLPQTEHVRGLEPKADFIVYDGTDFVPPIRNTI